jgi:hypothetical protein
MNLSIGKNPLRAGRPRVFSRPYTVAGRKKRGFCGLLSRGDFSRPYTVAGAWLSSIDS